MDIDLNPLKNLPSVDALLNDPSLQGSLLKNERPYVVSLVREYLDFLRKRIKGGVTCPSLEEIVAGVTAHINASLQPSLFPVINGTGVIIHTNLGRALLSEESLAAMRRAGQTYNNLEYSLEKGQRGSRYDHATRLLRLLTGAEDALVVNNNAGALVLVLSAFAKGRETLISRAHLVEIGGGFRVPDIMAQSGSRLVEVGTTNRTYLRDYQQALREETALIFRVHASNFLITGFTTEPSLDELVRLGREQGLPVVYDLGSGALLDTTGYGLAREPLVQDSVAAGVDLTCFSGDKLLGGPQAGIIVGRQPLIAQLRRHPLTRALRVDKTTLAALQATLLHYVRGEAEQKIPVWQMIGMKVNEIEARATRIVEALKQQGIPSAVVEGFSAIGGGSLPGQSLPTRLISVAVPNPSASTRQLRSASPPVIARIEDDRLVLDLRTVLPQQDETLQVILNDELGESGVGSRK
ncbi:MAG: L-seryl-tRNA(Sec) selenium transferase [Chloroflexi bacterium]|nr:L-seryl-tRNA(Sec) selenium transferase [Chloroflexota bacterium]